MNLQFRGGFGTLSRKFSDLRFGMDFLNHREEGVVFYQVFLLSPLETVRVCISLKKYKSQDKAVEVTMNSKEENS